MFIIDNILVDEAIANKPFLCDTAKCKGACCTFSGGSGAPLREAEIQSIENSLPAVKEYLRPSSIREIEKNGWMVAKDTTKNVELSVRCIEERDCVFVFYEESETHVAKCALERAFYDGKTDFQKPISCHLFPIREADFGGRYLFYEKFSECAPALELGKKENVILHEAVQSALKREFGEDWYSEFQETISQADPAGSQDQ